MRLKQVTKKSGHPLRMVRNLATSLILYERIKTTCPRARATQKLAERWLNLARDKSLKSRRAILRQVSDKMAYKKLMEIISPKIKANSGGRTRIYKLAPRRGDGALVCLLELAPKLQTKAPSEVSSKKKMKSKPEAKKI